MDKFLSTSFTKENTISIIGDNSQVFQILLKKNDSIIVNSQYVSYASSNNLEETPYSEVNSLINITNSLIDKSQPKVSNSNIIRLKNTSNNFEYIGVSKGGKILKILPLLYDNLFIRLDSIIAFSESPNTFLLVDDKEVQKKIMTEFYGRINLNSISKVQEKKFVLIKDVKKKKDKNLDEFSGSIAEINNQLNDFVYLSGENMLIEKRLGEGEQIIIMKDGLLAFEKSVSFYKVKNGTNNTNNKYVNSYEDIVVEGPGLIIFEVINRKVQIKNKRNFFAMIISLIILSVVELVVQIRFNPLQNL